MHHPSRFASCLILLCFVLAVPSAVTQARQSAIEGRLPPAAQVPAGKAEVVMFAGGTGVDRQAAVLPSTSGGFVLVYSTFERGDLDSSRLMIATSERGGAISAPRLLGFGNAVEDAPSFVSTRDGTWLYFASSDADLGNLKMWRARVVDDVPGSPQRLADVDGLSRLNQWPRWVSAGEDVLMTFRGRGSVPMWLLLGDGVAPERPMTLSSEPVAYPRVVPMHGKGCFFSYQRPPEGGYMATWYRVSRDCQEWSPSRELRRVMPPSKPDVHDAYALPRGDGGVDVYYVYPSYKGEDARFPVGFDLYRRSVMLDGTAGPEQLLTEQATYNPFAPSAHRLSDGTILVTFSDIQESGMDGVTRANLVLFKLGADALLPR